MKRSFRLAVPFALVLAAACTDAPGAVAPPLVPPSEPALAVVQCTARVADRSLRCESPKPGAGGASADLIVGGQGVNVQLRSSNVSYDAATGVFGADLTLQNLLGQPVGTEDGATATGIRVFFHVAPSATAGSGAVEVANPDGVETFTGSGQPFFHYPDVLAPYERTAPKRWEWSVPASVESFAFQVFVSARVPNQQGVLRWTRERGEVTSRSLYAVWGTGPNDIWASGHNTMMYNNGTRWVVIPGDWQGGATSIHGSSTDNVWAAGHGLWRYDGRRWTNLFPPPYSEHNGVWVAGKDDVFVTTASRVLRWDGAVWDTMMPRVSGRGFNAVWGAGPNDVFVVGGTWNTALQKTDGHVWHWDGAQWDSVKYTGQYLSKVWGTSGSDVYAVGQNGFVARWDGTSWTQVAQGLTTMSLNAVWGTGPDDVWVAGGGYQGGGPQSTVLHWDGAAWSLVPTGGPRVVTAGFSPNPDKVYLVGYDGMVHKRSGGAWQEESRAARDWLYGVWPVAEDDAYAVRCGGVLRGQGPPAGWQVVHATPNDCLEDVWATPGGGQVFAVGYSDAGLREGVIVRWDGSEWQRTTFPDVYYLHGVWGLDATHVYAVGMRYSEGAQLPVVLRWDGASWTEMETGQPYGILYSIWGTSPDNLYAVGTSVLRWDGTSWSSLSVHHTSDNYRDVWGTGPDNVYIAGGRIYHWNGSVWNSFSPRLNFAGYGVWGSSASDVYVVGTQSLHFNGASWTEVNMETSSDLLDITGLDARNVWAVGAGDVVMRGRR